MWYVDDTCQLVLQNKEKTKYCVQQNVVKMYAWIPVGDSGNPLISQTSAAGGEALTDTVY